MPKAKYARHAVSKTRPKLLRSQSPIDSLRRSEKLFQTALVAGATTKITKALPNVLGAIDKALKSGAITDKLASRKKSRVSFAVVKILKDAASKAVNDKFAFSVAHVLATANERAKLAGWSVADSVVTIRQYADSGGRWRVNYGTKNPVQTRGGDLLIELDARNARVTKVLFGQ